VRRVAVVAAALGTLAAAPSAALATAAGPGLRSAYGGTSAPAFLGGWLQPDPTVHLIFWGPQWAPSNPVAIAERTLFRELAGTGYNSLLGQYGVQNDVRLAGVWFDRSAPPTSRRVTVDSLLAEALRARRFKHWRDNRDSQWLILPQPGADLRAFPNECGEHDLLWSAGKPYVLALIPPFEEPMFSANCIYDYSSDDGTSPTSLVAATTSVTSHEYAEAATDPNDNSGWMVKGPASFVSPVEIADLCYFYSGMPTGLTVNVSYLWDDSLDSHLDGCML
jgi:hypothetical protein